MKAEEQLHYIYQQQEFVVLLNSQIQNLFTFYLGMSRSTNKRIEPNPALTDRSQAKSTGKEVRGLTFTREIVIRTQEPDIPQITILKVQRSNQSYVSLGFHQVERIFDRVRLKRLFQGFSQMCSLIQSSKIRTVNINRLTNILKTRQKKLMGFSWGKILSLKFKQKSKLNTSRLLSKLSLLLINKAKLGAFNKIKEFVYSKIKRSITEMSEASSKKASESFQMQLTKVRSQQFSEKFITLCKKYLKYNNKKFIEGVTTELEPNLLAEVQRYQQIRKNQGLQVYNEVVLVVLSNHILAIKDLRKDWQEGQAAIKEFQGMDAKNKLAIYEKIQKQFEQADNEIRALFEKHNKIQEKELSKIIEAQLRQWNRLKEHSLYNSRLFVSAIIGKLLKDGLSTFNQYLSSIEIFLRICSDEKKIEEFKKNIGEEGRAASLLIQIANKFVELHTFGMPPIMEKGFSQNEEAFMSEIKYIRDEMKDFIAKFNNPAERVKLKKTFSSKKAKAPEELRELYVTINELIGLIQNSSLMKKQSDGDEKKKLEMMVKIFETFRRCLKEGSYKKWEAFINAQVNKEEFKGVLAIIDQINDIINEKINEETAAGVQEIGKLKAGQAKMKQQNDGLKAKNLELERKLKGMNTSRTRQDSKQKAEKAQKSQSEAQLEKKYNQLQERYDKLQKSQQKSLSASKIQNEKELNGLKKKLEDKDEELKKLKDEMKATKDKSVDKSKIENEKKALQQQIQSQLKELEGNTEKLKQELQNKNKQIQDGESKIKKFEIEIKRLQSEIKRLENENKVPFNKRGSTDLDDSNQIRLMNQNLNRRVIQLEQRVDLTIRQLEAKDVQLQNARNSLINQQRNQMAAQKVKTENEALNRKVTMLNNNIESLKHELNQKIRRIQQLQRQRLSDDPKKQVKQPYKSERNVEHSLELIRQLNNQLQKLKKSQVTLEQINKELENVHHRGQDVQVLISKIELQNNEYKKSMIQKDKSIFDLKAEISRLNGELMMVGPQISKLTAELNDRDQTIKRLENTLRDRETLANKDSDNKRDYIRKLEGIINVNETTIGQLNLQIRQLRMKEPETPQFRNQAETLENALRDLKAAHSKIASLELSLSENERKYQLDRKSWEDLRLKWDNERQKLEGQVEIVVKTRIAEYERKYESERRNWDSQRSRWEADRKNMEAEIQRSYIAKITNLEQLLNENDRKYQLEKKTWEDARLKWDGERQRLDGQVQNVVKTRIIEIERRFETERRNWDNERIRWETDRKNLEAEIQRSYITKITNLEQLLGENDRKYQVDRKNWQTQLHRWETERRNFQLQIQKSGSSKIANLEQLLGESDRKYQNERRIWDEDRGKWQIQRKRLEGQLQRWMLQIKKWQADKVKLSQQRDKLEIQWKNFLYKYDQATSENARLLGQLNQLNTVITQLRQQIVTMGGRSINVDNIVLLLSNITVNFIRIHPKPNAVQNQKTAEQIFKDLSGIKESFINSQEDMFANLENYIVRFVQADIGRYRYELALRIDQLSALRDRLVQFLNNEIEISKKSLTYQYSYELKEKSTAAKSVYETPAKGNEMMGFKITQEIREIREKTMHAQKLF